MPYVFSESKNSFFDEEYLLDVVIPRPPDRLSRQRLLFVFSKKPLKFKGFLLAWMFVYTEGDDFPFRLNIDLFIYDMLISKYKTSKTDQMDQADQGSENQKLYSQSYDSIYQERREPMSQLASLLKPSLVFLDLDFTNREEALTHLAQQMVKQGYAKESYPQAILQREETFPTGLQTNICGVAIPHTDSIHVKMEAVSIARLRQPVCFQMMGMNDQHVPVSLIFMLAIKEAHGQLEMLQELTSIFQNGDSLKGLLQVTSVNDVLHHIQSIGGDDSFERSNP